MYDGVGMAARKLTHLCVCFAGNTLQLQQRALPLLVFDVTLEAHELCLGVKLDMLLWCGRHD